MNKISTQRPAIDPAMAGMTTPHMTQRMTTWKSVRNEVLARIRDGRWRPGQLIPTETELASEFNCARATINRALTSLAATGLLERRRKVGTRVAEDPPSQSTLPKAYLRDDIEALGTAYGYRLLLMTASTAPADIADTMIVPRGTHLTRLHAEFSADSRPYCCEERWINPAVIPTLTEAMLHPQSPEEWLDANVALNRGSLAVCATNTSAVDEFVRKSLHLGPHEALLQVQRVHWANADVVSLSRQYFPQAHTIGALF